MHVQDPDIALRKAFDRLDVAWLKTFVSDPQTSSYINHHPTLLQTLTDITHECFIKRKDDWIEVLSTPDPRQQYSSVHQWSVLDLTMTCATRQNDESTIKIKEGAKPPPSLSPCFQEHLGQHLGQEEISTEEISTENTCYFQALVEYICTCPELPFLRRLSTSSLRRLMHHAPQWFDAFAFSAHAQRLKSRGSLSVLLKMLHWEHLPCADQIRHRDWLDHFKHTMHPEEAVDIVVEMACIMNQNNDYYTQTIRKSQTYMEACLAGKTSVWWQQVDQYQSALSEEKQMWIRLHAPFFYSLLEKQILTQSLSLLDENATHEDQASGRQGSGKTRLL